MSPGKDRADLVFLREALALAERGLGATRPNPVVGAVVVRDGETVGRGWHRRAGEAHAEAMALDEAGEAARGATLYVSLEPCDHQGRTPPCSKRIVTAGVARVVAPLRDPNPRVDGRGFAALERAGLRVETGSLVGEARRLNEAYLGWRASGRAFTTLKLAVTLDGRLATRAGRSRWITGPQARAEAHAMRARSDAILVGSGTALADDPRLTPRPETPVEGPPRVRVVLDRRLRLSPDSLLARTVDEGPVLVYAAPGHDAARRRDLEERGLEVVETGVEPDGLDLVAVLRDLAEREVHAVQVEGGGRLAGGLLARGLVDKLAWFVAPLVLGDERAVPAIAGLAPADPGDGLRFEFVEERALGEDRLYLGYPHRGEGGTRCSPA